jgi:hypothetical protein
MKLIAGLVVGRNRTYRQQQNGAYALRAMGVLAGKSTRAPADGPYAWIFCDEPRVAKISVLAELGRLGDSDEIRDVARQVCKERMPAKRAAAFIRRARLGTQDDCDRREWKLYRLLARTILDYLHIHPTTTLPEVCGVLRCLISAYKEPGP